MTVKDRAVSSEEINKQKEYIERVRKVNEEHSLASGKRRRAFVLTLGCQQNEADSEKIAGMAEEMGYEIVTSPEEADLIMVNTCAIREHAEKKALSIIGQYKHIRAKNPDLIIGVCGCMTAQEHRREELKMKYPYVTFTLGTASLHHFPKVLWDTVAQKHRFITAESEEDFTKTVAEGAPIRRESGYRAWVSVMYGCNNFCSYCIVPYVRGRERSREAANIIAECRELIEGGIKEGNTLLMNAGASGLASVIIPMAKAFGARVITTVLSDELKKKIGNVRVIYIKGEDFANQLIDSISRQAMNEFRDKYRSCDVLLIDDIQFIAGKNSTQEEFFHTFNALHEAGKQIIMTSDRPPREIKTLEDRLKTRFEWGLIADIQPPDLELRMAIIKKKADQVNVSIPDDVLTFLAENLRSNVRQIEGAIKKLGAKSFLTGRHVTMELARDCISDLLGCAEV